MNRERRDLFGEAVSGTASPERWARLQELLAADAETRRAWREYVNVHVGLKTYCALPGAVADPLPELRRQRPMFLAAAALLLAALGLALLLRSPEPALGRLSRSSGARWGSKPPGPAIPPGRLDLVEGFAEITLENGVRLVLESPVGLELLSGQRARLDRGRVVAHVPDAARGFTLETPRARLIPPGAEFGAEVRADGETQVQVFLGGVVAESAGGTVRLEAGRAWRWSAGPPEGIPFEPERYVRMFPTDTDGGQPAGPIYNRSRLGEIRAVPAPGPVTADGELGEWDRRAAFSSACWPPYHESHTLEGMLMYDERFLYVAARVGDPAPLRSVMDPQADPKEYAWRGGSVILRLAADPALQGPFTAKGPPLADAKHPEIGRRPEDVNERIAHLTFWFHRPSGRPRLQVSYGMDFHGERVDPPGWSGAFRAHPNGLGYTMEYAVPWSLLNAGARPPRAGDRLPSTWTVHWSDQEGRLSRGHLVEGVNLSEPPYRFLRGETWGRALFEGR